MATQRKDVYTGEDDARRQYGYRTSVKGETALTLIHGNNGTNSNDNTVICIHDVSNPANEVGKVLPLRSPT